MDVSERRCSNTCYIVCQLTAEDECHMLNRPVEHFVDVPDLSTLLASSNTCRHARLIVDPHSH